MNKKIVVLIFLILCACFPARAQLEQPPLILTSDPTGACPNARFAVNVTTDTLFYCSGSAWVQASATGGGGGGTVTGVTASSPLSSSGGAAPDISCATASGSLAGCLSSANWTTFNGKVSGSGTSGTVPKFTGTSSIGDSRYEDDDVNPSYDGAPLARVSDIPAPLVMSNALLSGCGVTYSGTGLVFTVQTCSYRIAGNVYTTAQTDVTLSAADATHPRIDAIIVNDSEVATKLDGTPGATPAKPAINPVTQLDLTFTLTAAGATTPSNVTTEDVYLEDAEWTCSSAGTGTFDCADTSDPFAGTKAVSVTDGAKNSYINFAKGSDVTLSNYNNLVFYIQSKATWHRQRSIVISFIDNSAIVGSSVTFNEGAFGFDSSVTTSYQQITIPTSAFGAAATVDTVRFTIGGGGSATIGYFLDNVKLQGGVPPQELPADMMLWKGAYSASQSYEVNDVILYGSQIWVALLANTASAPTKSNTNWKTISASTSSGIFAIGPDVPPLVPGSLNDEFDGSNLDTGRWTWYNQGTSTASVGNSVLGINLQRTGALFGIVQTAPATPWTVTSQIQLWGNTNGQHTFGGLVLRESGTGKLITLTNADSLGYRIRVDYWNSPTSNSSTAATTGIYDPSVPVYMRIQDDGTNLTFSWAADGVHFWQFFQAGRTAFLAAGPNQVGITGENNHGTGTYYVLSDWFRRTQ